MKTRILFFFLLGIASASAQTFSRINSLPVQNTPTSTYSIPAADSSGVEWRIPFSKFGGGGSGTIANTTDILIGDNAGAAVALTSGTGIKLALQTPTSANFKAAITDELGVLGGKVLFALGELDIPSGKVVSINNTLIFTGTDGSTLNIGAGGTLQTVALTGAFADLTGTSNVVLKTGANTYTAGAKQAVPASATNSGLGLVGISSITADPSAAVEGDVWYRSDLHRVRFRNGTSNFSLATTAESGGAASEQAILDVNGTWTNSITTLRQSVALSANRTTNMPAANSFPAGTVITFVDAESSSTSAFGRSFVRAGSDTLDGGTTPITYFLGNGNARFETNGVSAWIALDTRSVITSLQDDTDPTKIATFDLSGLTTGTSAGIVLANSSTLAIPKVGSGAAGEFIEGINPDGSFIYGTPAGTGAGTVTNFSAGDLSPLFTTSEATTTTTPALSFTLANASAQTFYGNETTGSAPPHFVGAQTVLNTIGGAKGLIPNTSVKTGAYTMTANELTSCDDSAGSFALNLPNAPPDTTRAAVKIVTHTTGNSVTLNCQGSDVLNKVGGSTSIQLTLLNQVLQLQYKASTGVWYIVTNDAPLSESRKARELVISSSSTAPTINTDNTDAISITGLSVDITSMTTNLTGTPSAFDMIIFRIKDNGTSRSIIWGASYIARGATLPTSTVVNKTTYVLLIWNELTSTWDCISTATEA